MANKVTHAVGYIRVSSDAQIKGESLATQESQIIDYCKKEGWRLVKVYDDPGFSGSTIERPNFQLMINDAKKGKFEKLVIRDISRAARNSRQLLNIVEELRQYKVSIVSIKENIDVTNHYGEAMFTVSEA